MNKELNELPASLRVIGVGKRVVEIIDKVKSFGFDCISAELVNSPTEVTPSEVDQLAIIVFIDNVETANLIAKSFHQAGVLTLGLSDDADPSCFDSIVEEVHPTEYPDVIKALLQTILKPGYVSFDLHDLSAVLGDSGYFIIKRVIGDSIKDVVEKMQEKLKEVDLHEIGKLTFNIFSNRDRNPPIKVADMRFFSDMFSTLPDTVNIHWAMHIDDELNDNQIGLISIMSGKDLDNVQ